jgi:raffinose/stachyose/melibiose transport system substrate-binding protein
MKRCAVLCCLIAAVLAVSGCAPKTQQPASSQSAEDASMLELERVIGTGKTRFKLHTNSMNTNLFWAEEFVKRNPDVTIEIQRTYQGLDDMLSLMENANSLPDVFQNGALASREFSKMGVLSDITADVDREWLNNFNTNILDNYYANGRLYGVPSNSEAQGVWFNKALFDKYNLAIPVTFDEYKRAISVFKQNGVLTIAHGGRDNWCRWVYDRFFHCYGLEDVAERLNENKLKFTDPGANFLAVFERIKEWADLGAYPANVTTMDYTQAVETFRAGNAAMITTGTWELGAFRDPQQTPVANDIVFGWGPEFPELPWNQKVGLKLNAWGFFISKNLESRPDARKAAVEFLKFVNSPAGGRLLVEKDAALPAAKADLQGLTLPPLYVAVLNKVADEYVPVTELSGVVFDGTFTQPYWNAVRDVAILSKSHQI